MGFDWENELSSRVSKNPFRVVPLPATCANELEACCVLRKLKDADGRDQCLCFVTRNGPCVMYQTASIEYIMILWYLKAVYLIIIFLFWGCNIGYFHRITYFQQDFFFFYKYSLVMSDCIILYNIIYIIIL